MNLLELKDLNRHFGTVKAVDAVSLTVQRGQFITLLGPSGCGKTTTLRLIAGFEKPDSGTIHIGGQMVVGQGAYRPPEQRRIGMVFQDYALFPHLNVADNIGFGLKGSRAEKQARVEAMLELVALPHLADRMPHA
ncbi:MAG: ABC transporter ATP-binding protein, partial [Anaerolineae bacterium]|nr:ABC transporter ATP-binding protein [Anaerolineae bacterium]